MNNSPQINDAVTKLSPSPLGTPKRQKGGNEEENSCAGENNKRRKPNGKATPRRKGSKQNSTPKKNVSSTNGMASPGSAQKIDLRLEAKLSAEENSRMYAGRQIHPFFSPLKSGKKSQKLSESERSLCTVKREDKRTTSGPIHVFESFKDDNLSLDWRDWTFLGETTITNCGPESSNSSILVDSSESLNFDNLRGALISENSLPCSDQLSMMPEYLEEILPENATMLANEQTICPQMPEDSKLDLDVDEIGTSSGQASIFRRSDAEPLSRFQERMRFYYHSCEDRIECSLWTHKYKPTKASEVCGNDESVNFLRDWLHLWHERRYQSRKDSSIKDQCGTQNDDFNCSDSDYDLEDCNEKDSLQNVLLITGPIGSGKSAAVYACAQEQGFEVLELNASDCRNGVAVKQYFGDTLGSRGFKRSLKHQVSSQQKTLEFPPGPALPNCKATEEMGDGMIEMITISDDEVHSPRRSHGKNNVFTCYNAQTLILVEDVDILFPEDRGCIAAIQRIAETAKGPIILTSNSNNPGLPYNLDRLSVSFSLPSLGELLCQLYTVCVKEEVAISPLFLRKFIQSCNRDIRKTIMHLQFWFQSKKYSKDKMVQTVYGSLPFDLEAGHQILPEIIPWSFPSELSKLIEKEVAKSITIMEEKSFLQGLVEKELYINGKQNDLDVLCMVPDFVNAEKVEMIDMNRSITDCSEFESQNDAISQLSNCSGLPVASSWQMGQSNLVLMSSNSRDEDPKNEHFLNIHDEAYKRQSFEGNGEYPFNVQLNQSYNNTPFRKLVFSGLEDSRQEQCQYFLETADDTFLNETCNLKHAFLNDIFTADISSVPEPIFVPETAIENGIKRMSGAMSSGHLAGPVEVSPNNELSPFTFSVCERLAKLSQKSDLSVNTEIPESSAKAVVRGFQDDNVLDKCNHADFKFKSSAFAESSPSMETDVVQNLWRKLRDGQTNLRQHATSEQLGAIEAVKLASGMSNLISESDLLFRNHQQKQCGIMEPPMDLSDEAAIGWYDEQMMMSTIAVHGFCFYAQLISDMGQKLGYENRVDLPSEILASTTNVMALGKLSRQDHTKRINKLSRKQLEVDTPRNYTKRDNKTSLFNVIQSIVPARLSLALKGTVFNEYISSLRQISVSEGIRISQDVEKKRGRSRVRGSEHYLSKGKMMLSPEDISLVCEGDLYRKISSQHKQ
ncbi:PREDICTED: uncharacterized protein LOC109337953 isoform X1 [Lupinus angustifolius]|uniref:uncharacterized protein LOC109337953 isoform X1 n=1 Tax=Lupinus angustifolius TaxID=3871 RepID=UPI00092FBB55|nr:PREDICTED: uncharacterized protein LOC109337953 isoform X1 [Lupinus angustifolius]